MARLFLDCETRSVLDLAECGLDAYATHSSTEFLMCAWAVDNEPVQLWEKHVQDIPRQLHTLLTDKSVTKIAWNSSFERYVFNWILGIDIPIPQWFDPSVNARYLSIPGSLKEAGKFLGLSSDHAKMDQEGKKLIRKFCFPASLGGEETLFGISKPSYFDYDSAPRDWETFKEYCKRDVVAEREILAKMVKFPLPQSELETWFLDQEINDRGVYVDLPLVKGAVSLSSTIKKELTDKLLELTKLENPNSRDQMLAWCQQNGYPYHGLGKNFVNQALAGTEINDNCRTALTIRQQAAKTSDTKFDAILSRVSADSRLRHSYVYMGAARTHRWSGHGVQTQNLPRPIDEVNKNIEAALEAVHLVNCDRLKQFKYKDGKQIEPLDVIGSCIRSAFIAKPGHKLVICDLSAIENRVLGYICKAPSILRVFEENLDPYKYFAVDLYGKKYEEITKLERQNAKPPVLGCGYGLSGGEQTTSDEGDIVYTGLMKYGRNMNIAIDKELADRSVEVFRRKHHEVVQCWWDLDNAAMKCIQTRRPQSVNDIVLFEMVDDVLKTTLPSGRALHYLQPKIVDRPWYNGKTKKTIEYWGMSQEKHQFCRVFIYGSKFLENFDQSISRDLLVHGMKLATRMGFNIIMHTHDELVAEQPIDSPLGIKELRLCMVDKPLWGNDQLILDAAGFESEIYRKE